MNKKSEKPLPTSTEGLNANLRPTRVASLSRLWNLPPGWEHYFQVRGNGQIIACPCGYRPGQDVPGHRRWKDLGNHMAVMHNIQRGDAPPKLRRVK